MQVGEFLIRFTQLYELINPLFLCRRFIFTRSVNGGILSVRHHGRSQILIEPLLRIDTHDRPL